jgi:hypothetical protein
VAIDMHTFLDDPLGLDPLGPLPVRDTRWFIAAHGPGTLRTAHLDDPPPSPAIPAPDEVFLAWRPAQDQVDRLARDAVPASSILRTTGFLRPDLAERVADWFTGTRTAPADAVRRSYGALERETARLSKVIRAAPAAGGLGVVVNHVRSDSNPYPGAAELCAELREHGSMTLATIAGEAPHPLLGGRMGGVFDQLRVVHDVFGHAALGVGFDLQSEFAAWLQCRALFSPDARAAAFCELVGAPTTYIITGERPALRADLPPAELVAACASSRRQGAPRAAGAGS